MQCFNIIWTFVFEFSCYIYETLSRYYLCKIIVSDLSLVVSIIYLFKIEIYVYDFKGWMYTQRNGNDIKWVAMWVKAHTYYYYYYYYYFMYFSWNSYFIAWVHKTNLLARHWWITPVILATQEAEIRRIAVWTQPGQIVHETLSQKKKSQNKKEKRLWSGSRCRPWVQTPVPKKKNKRQTYATRLEAVDDSLKWKVRGN
jgi:hypothetical protein